MPKAKKVETKTEEPVVVEQEVVQQPEVNNIEDSFSKINTLLSSWKSMYSELTTEVKKLQKFVAKANKEKDRSKKMKSDKPKRAPSGFAKPTKISNELCDFLQQSYGTEMARTEVTKHLTKYIKANNLQAPEDKRKILPDKKLTKLLKLPKGEQVTYFNLQKWMKPHFASAKTQVELA